MNIAEKLSQFSDYWTPHIIAQYNGNEVRVAKLLGEFDWHAHKETDELFLVIHGELHLHFRDRVEVLRAGDLTVVPKGVEHKPVAPDGEVHILFMDRAGEPNTGTNPQSEKTVSDLQRI